MKHYVEVTLGECIIIKCTEKLFESENLNETETWMLWKNKIKHKVLILVPKFY